LKRFVATPHTPVDGGGSGWTGKGVDSLSNRRNSTRLAMAVVTLAFCTCDDRGLESDRHFPYWNTVQKLESIARIVELKQPVEAFTDSRSMDDFVSRIGIAVPTDGSYLDDVRIDGWRGRMSFSREGDGRSGTITIQSVAPEVAKYGKLGLTIESKTIDGEQVMVVNRLWKSNPRPK